MGNETERGSAQSEMEHLAFLLSCYDVWSASRPGCFLEAAGVEQEEQA